MWIDENATVTTINTANVWEEVEVFTQGNLLGWSFGSNGELIAGTDSGGVYEVSGFASCSSTGAAQTFDLLNLKKPFFNIRA